MEHRLFCYITKNWHGKPSIDVQTAIDLIGTTQTTTGLAVICVRDDTEYELAKKVSDEDFATINMVKIAPFETWTYRILLRSFVHVIVESQCAADRALPVLLERTLTPASAKGYVRIAVGNARCGRNRIKLLNRLWVSETEPEKF
jgi:hypothetical protein